MKWKIVFIGFFALTSMSFSKSEEINREEIRKLEKAEAKDEIQLNELEENIEAIGDEIRSIIYRWEYPSIASEKPLRLSIDIIKISSVPRFLISVRTESQYFELSFSPIHSPKTSLASFSFTPILHILLFSQHGCKVYCIHVNKCIKPFKWS